MPTGMADTGGSKVHMGDQTIVILRDYREESVGVSSI